LVSPPISFCFRLSKFRFFHLWLSKFPPFYRRVPPIDYYRFSTFFHCLIVSEDPDCYGYAQLPFSGIEISFLFTRFIICVCSGCFLGHLRWSGGPPGFFSLEGFSSLDFFFFSVDVFGSVRVLSRSVGRTRGTFICIGHGGS